MEHESRGFEVCVNNVNVKCFCSVRMFLQSLQNEYCPAVLLVSERRKSLIF